MSTAARPTGGPEDPTDPIGPARSTDPARPARSTDPARPARAAVRVLLDWRDGSADALAEACVLCGQPTWCWSPRGVPCHKTCAEVWVRTRRPGADPTTSDPTGGDALAADDATGNAGERP